MLQSNTARLFVSIKIFCRYISRHKQRRNCMPTRRDLFVALFAAAVTLGAVKAQTQPPFMRSSLFEWNTVNAKQTDVGAVRQFFRSPTATLDELELHVTTLKPGLSRSEEH